MRLIQRIALAAAFAALVAATAWLLYQYAQWQVTAYLRDQAAHALVLAARAETPYQWRFDNSESVVASRVFNARNFAFRDGELVVQSSGDTFEIGLPLARPVDLLLFPHLQIVADADGAAAIRVVVHETLESPEHALAEASLVPGASVVLNLAAAASADRSDTATALPSKAAMLRVRVAAPPGTTVHLRAATLARAQDAHRVDLEQPPRLLNFGDPAADGGNTVYRLPLHADLLEADVAAMAKYADVSVQPLILLPQHARIEQQIGLRNAVYNTLPGAILIPERAIDATFAQAREEAAETAPDQLSTTLRWCLAAIYVATLVWSRVHPAKSQRRRALAEAVLAQAGPLWLILGERFDGRPDALQWLLLASSVLYAIGLSVPRKWRWNGSARTWLPAIGVVMLAAALGVSLRQPDSVSSHAIGAGHVLRYLGWAFVQQYLVCAVCTDRWRIVTGNSAAAAYLGAVGFALMHTPNAALMIATLFGGVCWCSLYLRERALLPLAVSHAASALVLLALLPRSLLASAEVSARFFQ